MQAPDRPADEAERLDVLRTLSILDTDPEERFDRLTRMARRMFGVPISLVSIVDADRQWFKSRQGLDAEETPRELSFCGHAILGDDVFQVPDAMADARFRDNPLVTDDPKIRFYAGCPIRVHGGFKMGTLCLIDTRPREFADEDRALLRDLAAMAEQELAAMQLATMDELTGISNRRGFLPLARHALAGADRHREPVALICLDLDDFKPINDRFGHAEGDRALTTFAALLREIFRDSDVYARFGGDEFAVLLSATDETGARLALERFTTRLAEENRCAARGYDIECSAGIAVREAGEDLPLEALMEQADRAMYAAKGDL